MPSKRSGQQFVPHYRSSSHFQLTVTSVSVEFLSKVEQYDTVLETGRRIISEELARLTHLHTLTLDLYYGQDINTILGAS